MVKKKCCVADCILDAVVMPQIKRGPVASMVEPAETELGVARGAAIKDESVRQKVLAKARAMAYVPLKDLACCNGCMPVVAADPRCVVGAGEALQFVPFR